jgi:NADPH-dependent 2,4-dienoyl-CoA reductase/sulfur reductase-like enzyme
MSAYHYLIIGNGAAGLSAAEIIRQRDQASRITIISNEPYLFYSRPGIAYFIMGQVPEKQLISRPAHFYKSHQITLLFGHVSRLDLEKQAAFLKNGEQIGYDVLLLATGATAVPAHFPGNDLAGVLTFDTLDDAKQVIHYGKRAKTAVVVGGGITAMELAEGLSRQGARTHLLQRQSRIWPRLFDEWESKIIESQIQHEGIIIHYDEEVVEILGKRGKVAGVRLGSGQEIDCQVLGVGIGVRPNRQLVTDLPIAQDKGVLVDQFMQSSKPLLFAAGDIAQVYDRWTKSHQLDVLWPSAISEGRAAGHNMVDVVRGLEPSFAYQKGSPFNSALLFGTHLSVIGQVSGQITGKQNGSSAQDIAETSYLSRGSSNVWTAPFTANHRSAWDNKGLNSLRIVMSGGRLVGALLMGNQELADPLRHFIDREIDLGNYADALLNGDDVPGTILEAWQDWHQSWQ